MISIVEAAAQDISRVRQPNWANPFDHVKIDIIDGKPGPWLHLYCPFNKECNGRDPVDIMAIPPQVDIHNKGLEPYTGPLSDSPEYQADVARYTRSATPAKGGEREEMDG